MPTSRRRSKHRHRAAHRTEHRVHPVPAWTDDERWFEPDNAHTDWVGQLYHEPAPWRSEEDDDHPPAHDSDYPPPHSYSRVPGDSGDPDYPAAPVDPRRDYPPPQEYPADDFDEGYEQHGPDETPALRGRLVRLPRRRAELPEAVRDCLHWGIFALVLVPIFLVATGGSVLNAVVVMISILVLGVVVIWVVRLGKIALPNLEPVHQLEPLEPGAPDDPIDAEWQEMPDSAGPGGQWPEFAATADEWPEPTATAGEWPEPAMTAGEWPEPAMTAGEWPNPPRPSDEWRDSGEWPDPPRPSREWAEPAWEPFLPPQPSEREHVGWPPRDQ